MALALEVQPHPADRAGPPISLLHKLTRNRRSKLTRLAQQPVVVPVIQAVAGAAGLFTDDGGARASSRVPVREVQPLPTWTTAEVAQRARDGHDAHPGVQRLLGSTVALITVTGRRTGRSHTTSLARGPMEVPQSGHTP